MEKEEQAVTCPTCNTTAVPEYYDVRKYPRPLIEPRLEGPNATKAGWYWCAICNAGKSFTEVIEFYFDITKKEIKVNTVENIKIELVLSPWKSDKHKREYYYGKETN